MYHLAVPELCNALPLKMLKLSAATQKSAKLPPRAERPKIVSLKAWKSAMLRPHENSSNIGQQSSESAMLRPQAKIPKVPVDWQP